MCDTCAGKVIKYTASEIKQIKQVDDALEQPEVRDEPEPLENGNDNESVVDETDEPKIDELISNPDLAGSVSVGYLVTPTFMCHLIRFCNINGAMTFCSVYYIPIYNILSCRLFLYMPRHF